MVVKGFGRYPKVGGLCLIRLNFILQIYGVNFFLFYHTYLEWDKDHFQAVSIITDRSL